MSRRAHARGARRRQAIRSLTLASPSEASRAIAGPGGQLAHSVLDSRDPVHYDAPWSECVQLSDSLFTFSHQLEAILEEEQ
jgi:hypothetical protein